MGGGAWGPGPGAAGREEAFDHVLVLSPGSQ